LAVSVIIPCLNEELSVAGCVEQALEGLANARVEGEVVVADNGSTDRSVDLATAAGARVVVEPKRGKGHATRTGIRAAAGEYIILADADGTYDLRQLKPLIDPLSEGYDMVVGNRLKGEIAENAMPRLHRYVGNPLIGGFISLVAGRRFGDCLSGLRSFRRDAWNRMSPRSPGFELETEICLRAGRHRLRVRDVPVAYAARQTPSKLSGPRDGWRIIRFILIDAADLILVTPAIAAMVLGVAFLAAGLMFSRIGFGSTRWEMVFAGSVLVPAAIAALVLGLATRWLHWQRGVVGDPGGFVRSLGEPKARRMEMFFAIGACLLMGLGLNIYLLADSEIDTPSPLALTALAQALLVSAVEIILGALLFGVLRGIPITADSDEWFG
jgi:cellulose synthase/poly-beta-1,6-N-acetylglucosamine synthase-like glycosyltransferase